MAADNHLHHMTAADNPDYCLYRKAAGNPDYCLYRKAAGNPDLSSYSAVDPGRCLWVIPRIVVVAVIVVIVHLFPP